MKYEITKEIIEMMNLPLLELMTLADRERASAFGSTFDICSIINAKSGLCSQDCKFCAQSHHYSTSIKTYPLQSKESILQAAFSAEARGAARFGLVTSGHTPSRGDLEKIAEIIAEIRNKTSLKICASLGSLGPEELTTLRLAGLSRYHHNIETSPNFYSHICTTHSFRDRIETIGYAKDAGLEVCSGGILGIGEGWRDRIEMALTLKDLAVETVPLNILIPIQGTPLEHMKPSAPSEILRSIALFRLILKDRIIKLAAGRESSLRDFQGSAFMAGANGMFVGGYLTVNGRGIEDDRRLIADVFQMWQANNPMGSSMLE
ncbi:MAG TPA: biotin synthase BioB, partial [Bacillota bacterium]|nr:biotin synthase BioB [Bacillota bacterium]